MEISGIKQNKDVQTRQKNRVLLKNRRNKEKTEGMMKGLTRREEGNKTEVREGCMNNDG